MATQPDPHPDSPPPTGPDDPAEQVVPIKEPARENVETPPD
ncbi:MAG: hypothetical protein JWR77_1901 [Rhizorhabdus sp.]|nr:hypothetical protein [Rhizorhabdus sp.]